MKNVTTPSYCLDMKFLITYVLAAACEDCLSGDGYTKNFWCVTTQ